MGNDIETIRSMGSDYWFAYVGGEKKSKQTDLNGTPEIHLSSQNIQSVLSQRKLFHTGGGKSENLSVHTLTIFFEGTNLDFFTL